MSCNLRVNFGLSGYVRSRIMAVDRGQAERQMTVSNP